MHRRSTCILNANKKIKTKNNSRMKNKKINQIKTIQRGREVEGQT